MSFSLRVMALLVGLLLLARPAPAQGVDLQLVLAVDASGSVSTDRFELQKQGYVAAFRNPRVLAAIQAGATGAIAVAMVQWTGPNLQADVVRWTVVRDAGSATALAAAIAAAPRALFSGGTSISGAIDHAMTLFPTAPRPTLRRVIDISGDGANNRGRPASDARDAAVAADVTINGLPILNIEPDLDEHYRDEVIGGDGAFTIAIDNYQQFADAILRKLITEISARPAIRFAGPP